jgi:ATP-dependent Lon protease
MVFLKRPEYNSNEFNDLGIHKDTGTKYNPAGLDRDGLNENGFDAYGYDRDGYNIEGYDRNNFDRAGNDKETGSKHNRYGFDKYGMNVYTGEKYDNYGFDIKKNHKDTGSKYDYYRFDIDGYYIDKDNRNYLQYIRYSPDGFDRDGNYMYTDDKYNYIGLDRDGYNRDGFNLEGYHKETEKKYDWDNLNKYGFNSEGTYKDTGEEYNSQDFNNEKKHRITKTEYDTEKFNIDGFNFDGFNRKGYHKETATQYDPEGFDIDGFNSEGIHKVTGTVYNENHFDKDKYHEIMGGKYNERGFKANKTYLETGKFFDHNGFDFEGFNEYGFDSNSINRYTQEKWNLKGFYVNKLHKDEKGLFDKEGYDIDGNHRDKSKPPRKKVAWETKLSELFTTEIVDKNKVLKNINTKNLPQFIIDYLYNQHHEKIISEGFKDVHSYLQKYKIDPIDKGEVELKLVNKSLVKLIDKFKGSIKLDKEQYSIHIPIIDMTAEVDIEILKKYPRLIRDGLWGIIEISLSNKKILVNDFEPFQLSQITLNKFKDARSQFLSEEWINLIINTIGLNYKNYNRREKLILISRQIPMVENNIFMMEFSKPGTGKTYTYEKISSYSRVIGGSEITGAKLFYDVRSKEDGVLVQYDSLLFDEIDKIQKEGLGKDITNKLYQYLASGNYDRGKTQKTSECSIIMAGNLPQKNFDKTNLLENLLHKNNTHDAFLDRLAGIIPGWELESIKDPKTAYTEGLCFSTDYFSEILHKMRSENYQKIFNKFEFLGVSQRDDLALKKITSGLIKLIYPDGNVNNKELREIAELAIEYRNSVLEQISSVNNNDELKRKITFNLKDI